MKQNWTALQRLRHIIVWIVALILLMGQAVSLSAHGYVVRSIPEDRSTLERPPTRLQYWFSEGLEPAFSAINLRNQNGDIIASGGVAENDDTLLALQISPGSLEDGAYIVDLRPAFASDGHVIVESRVFFVGATVEGIEGQDATTLPDPIEIIWKSLLYASSFLLFGIFMLYAYVLVPAWGNLKYPRGLLPPRVMQRLRMLIWLGIAGIAIANVTALLHQSTVFFGTGLTQVIEGGVWQVVRIGSRFGDVWNVRTFLWVVVVLNMIGAQYYGRKYPRTVRSFWVANVWVLAIMLGAPAVNSHIAGSLIMPWVGIVIHWLHTLAVAFWIAGIVGLTMILPVALRPYDGEQRQHALRVVMRRFSFYVVASVAMVITTGIYSTTNWFFTPADITTTYGASLGVKLLMVGLLLWVGALHHMALNPAWLERLPFFNATVNRARSFGTSMRVESVVAVGALILASVLSSTPIPEPEFAQTQIETPNAVQIVDDVTISMAISPGGPGVNTFDIVVSRGDVLLDDVRVEAQVVNTARDTRNAWDQATLIESGLYVTSNDAIDSAGDWLTLIDVRIPDGDNNLANDVLYRAAFDWQIREDAAVLQSRPPSPLTLLAAFAVLGSLIFALYPWLYRLYSQLDLNPASLLAAIGGTVVIIALTIFGVWATIQQQQVIEEQLSPPPVVINTILPDATSLARGQVLYDQSCVIMQTDSDFQPLLRQLRLLRDDELFEIIQIGWRDVPPCNAEFSTEETWDVINYFRTFRIRAES